MVPVNVTVANGDGIGEDIMLATLRVLKEAKADITTEHVEIGESQYKKGYPTGMSDEARCIIKKNSVFLKGPITTPQGKGYRSLNVAIRKELDLYANVRRCRAYSPYVHAVSPEIDVVIVRENGEDLYTGLEYRQTSDYHKAIKTITKYNSYRIVKYAFEYVRANGRSSVACCVKDNIMKITDGNFCQCFREVAAEYPDIEHHFYNIDIAAGWLAAKPHKFDVIVTENLYGDIISDIGAEVSGSIGLCSGSNIGAKYSMFEAVHGSAPSMEADSANPSALILAAVDMLAHLGQIETANLIYNGWLTTLESGMHTQDIYNPQTSKLKLGTRDFASALIDNLGSKPKTLKPSSFAQGNLAINVPLIKSDEEKLLVGVDMAIDWRGHDPKELADMILHLKGPELTLRMISARGVNVWPVATPVEQVDCYRCVFSNMNLGDPITHKLVNALLERMDAAGLDVVSMDKLYSFDGKPGFNALSD